MSDLPKCKLCGGEPKFYDFDGVRFFHCTKRFIDCSCPNSRTAYTEAQWRTLMTQQQAEPVRWMYEDGSVGDIDCGPTCIPLYTAPQAQPAPIPTSEQALVEALTQEFPLFDDDGLDETEHHCEWAMQQDRKRLHRILVMCSSHQPTGLTRPAEPGGE